LTPPSRSPHAVRILRTSEKVYTAVRARHEARGGSACARCRQNLHEIRVARRAAQGARNPRLPRPR